MSTLSTELHALSAELDQQIGQIRGFWHAHVLPDHLPYLTNLSTKLRELSATAEGGKQC